MKVYITEIIDTGPDAVFSTREKAQAWCDDPKTFMGKSHYIYELEIDAGVIK